MSGDASLRRESARGSRSCTWIDAATAEGVVTGAPALNPEKYSALFTALAAQLQEAPYRRNETEKRVRDRTDLAGASVGRNAINFVTQGLLFSGVPLAAGGTSEVLARSWVNHLKSLCSSAQMTLEPADEAEVEAWVLGTNL